MNHSINEYLKLEWVKLFQTSFQWNLTKNYPHSDMVSLTQKTYSELEKEISHPNFSILDAIHICKKYYYRKYSSATHYILIELKYREDYEWKCFFRTCYGWFNPKLATGNARLMEIQNTKNNKIVKEFTIDTTMLQIVAHGYCNGRKNTD